MALPPLPPTSTTSAPASQSLISYATFCPRAVSPALLSFALSPPSRIAHLLRCVRPLPPIRPSPPVDLLPAVIFGLTQRPTGRPGAVTFASRTFTGALVQHRLRTSANWPSVQHSSRPRLLLPSLLSFPVSHPVWWSFAFLSQGMYDPIRLNTFHLLLFSSQCLPRVQVEARLS